MGRAIDMEKDIDMLKMEVKRLENIIRGMSNSIDEMEDKSTKTKHIDIVDDVKSEEDSSGEKESNDERSSGSDRSNNNSSGNTKRKTKQAGSNSK
tara:strand:- start:57 stop:341 length:285 start_codon:yes stop_codon:yes gene_type:complete